MAATRLAVELLSLIHRPEHAVITKTLEGLINSISSLPSHNIFLFDSEPKLKYLNRNLMPGMMF